MYVAHLGADTLSVIDGRTEAVVATFAISYGLYGVGVNPTTSRVYVANTFENTVSVVDDGDSIAPTASPSQAPSANAAGWNNTNVNVAWNWSDNAGGSGIDPENCTTSSIASAEGTLAPNATCSDVADNQGSASYTVKIDKTAPTVSGAAATQPNASGWYNAPVTIHYTCSDALSGVANCPTDQVLGTEGSVVSSTAPAATDVAGNTASSNVVTVKIDRTAPTANPAQSSDGECRGLEYLRRDPHLELD